MTKPKKQVKRKDSSLIILSKGDVAMSVDGINDFTVEQRHRRRGIIEYVISDREQQNASKVSTIQMKMGDFLSALPDYPEWADNAYQRFYRRVFSESGHTLLTQESDPRRARALGLDGDDFLIEWESFSDFYELEKTINKFAYAVWTGAMGGETSRQLIFFVGDVGTGKSQILRRCGDLLVGSQLFVLEGCKTQCSPLRLIPRRLKSDRQFLEKCGLVAPFDADKNSLLEWRPTVDPDLDICPVCRQNLQVKYRNKFEDFPVTSVKLSRRRRIGITLLPPLDPTYTDIRSLIGSQILGELHKRAEGDPELMNFIGALNRGQGGLVEFVEFFKGPQDVTHVVITATQEHQFPAPGFYENLSSDAVLIAHSNFTEYERFRANPANEAMLDRLLIIRVPNRLRYTEEGRVYQKMLGHANLPSHHVSPLVLQFASKFAVLTRQKHSDKYPPLKKMRASNGDVVPDVSVGELRREREEQGSEEGFRGGVSSRFVEKAIEHAIGEAAHEAAVRGQATFCCDLRRFKKILLEEIEDYYSAQNPHTREQRNIYREIVIKILPQEIQLNMQEWLRQFLLEHYSELGLDFKVKAQGVLDRYFDYARKFAQKAELAEGGVAVVPQKSDQELFMSKIEAALGIKDPSSIYLFRREIGLLPVCEQTSRVTCDKLPELKRATVDLILEERTPGDLLNDPVFKEKCLQAADYCSYCWETDLLDFFAKKTRSL